jgi:uncharacterized protein HemY
LLEAGRQFMKEKKFQDAVDSFREALKQVPNDPTATRELVEAEKALKR